MLARLPVALKGIDFFWPRKDLQRYGNAGRTVVSVYNWGQTWSARAIAPPEPRRGYG